MVLEGATKVRHESRSKEASEEREVSQKKLQRGRRRISEQDSVVEWIARLMRGSRLAVCGHGRRLGLKWAV